MSQSNFIPLKPIPIKDRVSMVFVYYGRIDVKDGDFVVINEVDGEDRERKHIPVGSVASIMLEPGTRISHAAVKLAAVTGTLPIWVGPAVFFRATGRCTIGQAALPGEMGFG
jgi:CRISPR-associated protein Cas1